MKHIKTVFFLFAIVFCLKGNAQQLETLINEALENNPEIEKLDLQHQIALEKINEVNSLPNTQFNFGFMAVKPEMEMPMERFRVSAMQMFPWFGTIEAKKDYANSQSKTKALDLEIAQRKLVLPISNLYYLLYEIRAKQTVLDEQITLLYTYETLALTAIEVGNASAVDVLKLQIRQNELLKQKDLLTQQDQGIQAALNSLLNRAYNHEVTIVDDFEIPENKEVQELESIAQNPELSQFDTMYLAVEKSEQVNQKERAPSFGVGVEYSNQENSPMITSSFKDMVMPMLSLNIPIFNNKYKSQTKQNQLQLQEIQSQKKERFNSLKAAYAKAISQRNQAKITFNTEKYNFKKAKDAEQILIKSYETETIDFKDILDIQELQLKFQINQIEAIKTYYVQTTIINYLSN
ncbi:MAG: TolC family protein [Flavobacteriaceae bacterium]